MARLIRIPLDDLHLTRDLRGEVDVSDLVESLREVGQLHPILVVKNGGGYNLMAGNRRYRAAVKLGWKALDARVLDDLIAEMAAIDENLARKELPAGLRAKETAKRKAIYEEMHPETKHGATPGNQRSGKGRAASLTTSFAEATAEATGRSATSIKEDARLGAKAAPEVLDALDAGAVTKKDALALVSLPVTEQALALEAVIAEHISEPPTQTAPTAKLIALVTEMQRLIKSAFGKAERIEALCREHGASVTSPSLMTTRSMLAAVRAAVTEILSKMGGPHG